jgi:epoxyqueuosine reductase QueG
MSVHHNARLTRELKKVAFSNHVDIIGVSDLRVFDDIPISERPRSILDDARAVVVYAVKYKDSTCWFKESWCSQTQELLTRIDKKLREFLAEKGYKAHSFRTEGNPCYHYEQINEMPLPHQLRSSAPTYQRREKLLKRRDRRRRLYSRLQDVAISAGLGCYGKNGMIITPQYGPYVYLSMIITDAPLKPDDPFDEDLCADCNLCVEACPTGACTGRGHSYGSSKCKPKDCNFTCHRVCYEKILRARSNLKGNKTT